MKAIIFNGPANFSIEERPKPTLKGPDDVLIKVLGVGVCGTDIHILMDPPLHPARPGIIFGHEFCGQIEETGENVTWLKKGDKVIVDPHSPCGTCEQCRSNRPLLCTTLYTLEGEISPEWAGHGNTRGIFQDGGLTTYVNLPAATVYKIDNKTPFEIATLAEPISCVGYSFEKLNVHPGDTVCILGAGPIGLLFVCFAKASGASKIIVSEPSQYRRDKAVKCGATCVVDPTKEDLRKVVFEETNDLGVDHCIEAVGDMLMTAIDMARGNGKVLMFGHDETAAPPIKLGEIIKKEIEIHGGYLGKYYFEKTARIIESGIMPLHEIATHKFPLSRYQEALDLLHRREGLKVIIYPEDDE